MKTLFLVPELAKPGGVANYYLSMEKSLKDKVGARYFVRGSRKGSNVASQIFIYLIDYFRFCLEVIFGNYNVFVVNTSFGKSGCLRDSVFILILRLFKKKFIVFFRGWDEAYEPEFILKKYNFLLKGFLKPNMIIVLSSNIKNKLKNWGYNGKIHLETTAVDDKLLELQTDNLIVDDKLDLLFMSRVEKEKGIYYCIELHKELKKVFPKARLLVAGTGSEIEKIKKIANNKSGIVLYGYASGETKAKILSNSDFFLFPSTHGEGMPNAVLEAMAFGLPVLTTKCNGISDFFEENKMGYFIDDLTIENLSCIKEKILELKSDHNKYKAICSFNKQYAQNRFLAPKISERLFNILSSA
ncbi:MAG: glycosyltransferase family 4 protein [Balneola sp.]